MSKSNHQFRLFEGIGPKFKEAVFAILPVVAMIVIIPFCVPNMYLEGNGTAKFGPITTSLLISIVPLILGTTLFSIGVDKSIARIGEIVGMTLTKRKTIRLLLFVGFLMGFLATLAEPDLSVLASRLSLSGPNWTLIVIAAIGVGFFMVVAILRVVYNKSLKHWLTMGYLLTFTLGLFADPDFFTIVFDAGGVTTGVVTVPFILSIGVAVAKVLGGDNAEDDSFGYSGLCSLGTVLSVMVFGIIVKQTGQLSGIKLTFFQKVTSTDPSTMMFPVIESYGDLGTLYLSDFLSSLKDVAISMLPITVFFLVYNLFLKLKGKDFLSIIAGLVYTFLGLTLFLLGAEAGFIPMASAYGKWLAENNNIGLFLLLGFLIGAVSMLAEPSVKVLAENVSEVSRGVISEKMIYIALCLATGIAIMLNIVRVEYQIPMIDLVVPLFLFALLLTFFSTDIYVGIAIDAAGVATGTMASCFFLPMFIAFASGMNAGLEGEEFGGAILAQGFGVVGIMSVMPIIAVETLGIYSKVKIAVQEAEIRKKVMEPDDNQVIHLAKEGD